MGIFAAFCFTSYFGIDGIEMCGDALFKLCRFVTQFIIAQRLV